jgi:hypothetical protein
MQPNLTCLLAVVVFAVHMQLQACFSNQPKHTMQSILACRIAAVICCVVLCICSFKPAARMGDHEEVMSRSMLALTLKVEGGMWLNTTHRTA